MTEKNKPGISILGRIKKNPRLIVLAIYWISAVAAFFICPDGIAIFKKIYHGFIGAYRVSFGKGYRADFKDSYEKTKQTIGIIENMNVPPVPAKPPEKKPKPPKTALPAVDTKGADVPKAMSARYMEIAGIIEKFCEEKLNAEYKEICLRALAKLCRKRPSPVVSGKARTWACGIVYAGGGSKKSAESVIFRHGVFAEKDKRRQSDDLVSESQRIPGRYSRHAPRGSGRSVPQGIDPVYPRG